MYNISFNMKTTPEMVSKWCALKGYQATTTQMTANGQESIPNPETEKEFFERLVKAELMNVCVSPIQNAIYQQVNQAAQEQVENLRASAEKAMSVTITEEK